MLSLHTLDSSPFFTSSSRTTGWNNKPKKKKKKKMSAFSVSRATLSFNLQPISPSSSKPSVRTPNLVPFPSPSRAKPSLRLSAVSSLDVSKEDAALPNPEENPNPEEAEKVDPRRAQEKFVVLNTGVYECRSCGYLYDQKVGDPSYPVPPGLAFEMLPEDWRCPTCGAAQSFFDSKSVEIAGFAQNQQFGLGGNSLTSGQKVSLIYGTLFFFFVLFLSGYFIQ